MQNAQSPTANAAPAPALTVVGVERLTHKTIADAPVKYVIVASDGQRYDFSASSYDACIENPALKATIQFRTELKTDAKGKSWTSRYAYASGYSKYTSEVVAF